MPRLVALLLVLGCQTSPNDEPTQRTPPTDGPVDTGTETGGSTLPTVVLPPAEVVINELMARNDSTWTAPDGGRPDWVELLNVGDEPVQLRRLTLTDIAGNAWEGRGELAPGARLFLTSDDLGFALDSAEDTLTLLIDGEVEDQIGWTELERDVSIARLPDRTGGPQRTAWPTPDLPNGDTASPSLDAATETIFLSDTVHRIDFTLTQDAFERINTRDGNWGQAAMSFDGLAFDSVGLRLKGSASFDLMNGKPAFKVDMNRGVPGTRLRTLKGFNLHNGNVYDPTRARDHISYTLAREAGLMAPRVSWAEVYVNGQLFYMLIESHDDQMIEANFPGLGETGYIFEPNESRSGGWSWNDFGSGNAGDWDMEEGAFPPDPGVTEAISTVDDLVAGNATDAAVAELWNHVEKDVLLSYMAWESVVSHTDGYKAPNNWRVFVHPVDYKIHLLPAGAEWTWDNTPGTLYWGGALASWCLENGTCRREYGARALEVAELVGELDLQQEFEDVSAMLAPYIAQDPRSPHDPTTVSSQRQSTIANIEQFPITVARDICGDMPSLDGCTN